MPSEYVGPEVLACSQELDLISWDRSWHSQELAASQDWNPQSQESFRHA
jgi:hypothetical protein